LVPVGGLTVYYPSRTGSGDQSNSQWQAFPKGLRMLAGTPSRRTFDPTDVSQTAPSFACIGVSGPETNAFPADPTKCTMGLRAQLWFPMCWDGVNLDSPDHKSHMAYPTSKDGGNCPPTHTVRVPGVFFEVLFSVSGFPSQTAYQPFTFSCGDNTGYGFHGDFLSGWDYDILQQAINDPTCLASNTNNGNNVLACNALAPYVKPSGSPQCLLTTPIAYVEDLGMNHPLQALPGCNPVVPPISPPVHTVPCGTAQLTSNNGWQRFLLQPFTSNLYVGAPQEQVLLTASVPVTALTEAEAFTMTSVPNGGWAIQNDLTGKYCTAPNSSPVVCNRNSPNTWEYFNFIEQDDGTVAIYCYSNSWYLTFQPDGTLACTSSTIAGSLQKWKLINPNNPSVPEVTLAPHLANVDIASTMPAASSAYVAKIGMVFVLSLFFAFFGFY